LLGHQLLRPNVIRHVKDILVDFAFVFIFIGIGNGVYQFCLANAGNGFWRVVQTRSQLAGNQIGFIMTRKCQKQVTIFNVSGL